MRLHFFTAPLFVHMKVEYSLTAIGKEFHPVIEALQEWGQKYMQYLKEERREEQP